jgi:hypothetical protein
MIRRFPLKVEPIRPRKFPHRWPTGTPGAQQSRLRREHYPEGFYVEATVGGETVAGVWSTPYLYVSTSECLFVR